MTNTKIRVVSEPGEFESLSGAWDTLQRKSGEDNTIFLTHEWLLTWWKHFGDGKKLNVLLIEKETQLIGIIPLMRTEYRIGLFRIHALETIGSVNCNHVGIITSGNVKEAVSAFFVYLEDELAKGKLVLRLTLVPDDCEFFNLVRSSIPLPTSNLIMQEKVKTIAPYIKLPLTWDEYYRSLSPNRRHILHRKLRSLEQAHSVEFRDCNGDNLDTMLSRFIDLHERRWLSANVKGVFSDPKMEGFYRDLAEQFAQKGWLHFSCLLVDDEVVSAEYAFIYNRKFYCSTSARDIDYWKYNVGHLHQMFLIKYAIEKGLRELDFLKGDEPYKFHWTSSVRKYMNVVIVRRGLCSSLRLKLVRLFIRLHEIRQYSLKEIYHIYLMRRKEAKLRKDMRVETPV